MKNQNKKPILGKKYHKKRIAYPLLIVLMGVFLLPKTAYFSTINAENIIELTNKTREKADASPLTANQLLTKAAYEKARDLIKYQTFSHTLGDKKFSTWIKDSGYEYSFVGENLAIDFATSEGVVEAWLESPTHKKNLLNNKFTEIGVAVIEGSFQGKNSILVVQIFGTPLNQAEPKNLMLAELKNSDNNLSEFNIQEENLMTNVKGDSTSTSLLSSDVEVFSPTNYFNAVKINPALAGNEGNNEPGLINTIFSLSLLFFLSILTSLFFYKPLAPNNINKQ